MVITYLPNIHTLAERWVRSGTYTERSFPAWLLRIVDEQQPSPIGKLS